MENGKYYVIGAGNNLFESLTKEQIIAAITQAVSTHAISDVDTGFVTTIKEKNKNNPISLWVGTEAEFNAIEEKDQNCLYIKTDDSTLEAIQAQFEQYSEWFNSLDNLLFYNPDENDEVEIYPANSQVLCEGAFTNQRKAVLLTINLPKSLEKLGNNILIDTFKANIRHVAGGYIASGALYVDGGTDFVYSPSQTTYRSQIIGRTDNTLTISITRDDAAEIETTAANNTPVSVEINALTIADYS